MADQKISQLTGGGAAQATDEYVVARSGGNNKITGANVAAAATSVGTLSSLTVSGDLTVDTSTLKVDSANNRVGIGTASPSEALTVVGNIKLGTSGTQFIYGPATNGRSFFSNSDGTAYIGAFGSAYGTGENAILKFVTGTTNTMTMDASGNLGLGVTPSAWDTTYRSMELGRIGNTIAGYYNGTEINIAANAYYSGGWKYAVGSLATKYTTDNTGVHMWYTAAAGSANASISDFSTAKMTLDASGNLFLRNTSNNVVIGNSVAGDMYIGGGSTNTGLIAFQTGSSERARITSGGEFLVNTTTANGKIAVAVPDGTTNAFYAERTGGSPATLDLDFANAYSNWNSSVRYQIVAGGSGGVYLDPAATSWAAVSDERLKTALIPFENAVQKVCSIRTGTGRYLTDAEDVSRSFMIAQDVQAVLPEAVSVDADEAQTLGLRYSETIPLLVAAIKELTARLEALEP